MRGLIPVVCPHCGSVGQMIRQPPGSIIIANCPECFELVAIFNDNVLPLDEDTMDGTTIAERKRHLRGVLGEHIESLIDLLYPQQSGNLINEDIEEDWPTNVPMPGCPTQVSPILGPPDGQSVMLILRHLK